MTSETTITIGFLAMAVGAIFAALGFHFNSKIKAISEGRWQGTVNEKLDTILGNFKEMKTDVHEMRKDVDDLHTRVSVLENKKLKNALKETT